MTHLILATDKVSAEGLELLHSDDRFEVVHVDDSTSQEFREALAKAEALVVRSATEVDSGLLAAAGSLKAVGRAGVGIDNVDLSAASDMNVAVYNAPGGNTVAAAELTMALMLSLVRKVPSAERSLRDGRWDRAAFKGTELRRKKLGLIGAGRIGGEVAKRCRAFEMKTLVYDPYLTEERAEELGVKLVGLKKVIKKADVISVHVPLTDETRRLIDADALEAMKPSAVVINASRGGVIDEQALVEALKSGVIAGAALDVYEQEPLPADSPLRDCPNLVLTPHLGGSTSEAQVEVAREVATHIYDLLIEGDSSRAVNAPALS